MSSNLFRFGFTTSNCSDGEPSNKQRKDGEGSIQAGESSTQSEGSDKATSSSSYECKRTRKFLESWKKDCSWLEHDDKK